MAFMQIRGAQIKEHQITTSHIDPITTQRNLKIAENGVGGLAESVLNIDWASHHGDILEEKLIIDRVQKDNISIGGSAATSVDFTMASPASDGTSKGVILNTTTVKVRDHASGEPIHAGGVLQIETATVGSGASASGNVIVTVEADGLAGSPLAINVPVLDTDSTATAVAAKIRTALGNTAAITALFTVSGATDKVILTKKAFALNDASLNIAIDGTTNSTGVADAATSADTKAGAIDTNSEVYGKLTAVSGAEAPYTYTLSFYSKTTGDEAAYEMAANSTVDILYPQRFSLHDIPEDFLENERFVDGAADVTAHLNITQLAKEVFGNAYNLDNDGNSNNFFGDGHTVAQEIEHKTTGITNTTTHAQNIIDEVVEARGTKSSLDERLSVSLNDDGSLKIGSLVHSHINKLVTITSESPVSEVEFTFAGSGELDSPKSQANGDVYEVYVNGIKNTTVGGSPQAAISVSNNKVTVTMAGGNELYKDDIIELVAMIYGVDN